MWGRPDGVVLVLAILLGLLLAGRWKSMLAAAAIGLAVIAPWLVFCEIYYGSFIPHTIVAKDNAWSQWSPSGEGAATWINHWCSQIVQRMNHVRLWFSPLYAGCDGPVNHIRGARPLQAMYFAVSLVGGLCLPRNSTTRTIPIFAGGFLAYLLLMLSVHFSWYMPPWLAVAL